MVVIRVRKFLSVLSLLFTKKELKVIMFNGKTFKTFPSRREIRQMYYTTSFNLYCAVILVIAVAGAKITKIKNEETKLPLITKVG